jgi:hypothetical protein
MQHKLVAYIFYTYGMLTLPITEQCQQQEMNVILSISKINSFPLQLICKLKDKLMQNTLQTKLHPCKQNKKINGSPLHTIALLHKRSLTYWNTLLCTQPSGLPTHYITIYTIKNHRAWTKPNVIYRWSVKPVIIHTMSTLADIFESGNGSI